MTSAKPWFSSTMTNTWSYRPAAGPAPGAALAGAATPSAAATSTAAGPAHNSRDICPPRVSPESVQAGQDLGVFGPHRGQVGRVQAQQGQDGRRDLRGLDRL